MGHSTYEIVLGFLLNLTFNVYGISNMQRPGCVSVDLTVPLRLSSLIMFPIKVNLRRVATLLPLYKKCT